jgi:hypothetical protein
VSKRQLNIIYFIDSSKTRTIKIPLGRVSALLLVLSAVGVWSVGSAVLLNLAYGERTELTTKLRTALATVFDYETRVDGVYDIAYPSGKTGAGPSVAKAESETPPPAVETALAKLASDEPTGTAEEVDAAGANGEDGGVQMPAAKSLSAKSLPKARETAESRKPEPSDPSASGAPILVGNPVVESGGSGLQVRFDLTNKSGRRAEGYIWGVASFKSDKGEVTYIVDPPTLGVKTDGEVADPSRSANFGIRKFKKMSFNFPVDKGLNGTFTGIKIGVTDKSGANRTTYNVPVEIKIGRNDVPASVGTSR